MRDWLGLITGSSAGVSTMPCGVLNRPSRPRPSRSRNSNMWAGTAGDPISPLVPCAIPLTIPTKPLGVCPVVHDFDDEHVEVAALAVNSIEQPPKRWEIFHVQVLQTM